MADCLQHYENLYGETLSILEVFEKLKDNYPIIVRVVPKEYEIHTSQELPGDSEILLEKPRWLQFVLVRILEFLDVEKVKVEKGEEFVNERKVYVGKEFLIPVCYPGTFKLLNKLGRHSRYVSVSQIIKDLPRFIRINQDTEYTSPQYPHTTSTLPAGTTLEVKNVQVVGKVRYIKCKSTKETFVFRDNFPINCTAVDDPDEHTFLNLAGEFVLLPKDVQFTRVLPEDVVLKDDEDASLLLTLFGGPVRILKSFIRRNIYIAWIYQEATHCQTVGVVPRHIWNSQFVQLKTFENETSKQEYINQQFGENLDSKFAVTGLYMLKPVETDVIWLTAPKTKKKDDEKLEDYEAVEKKLVDYENVMRLDEKMVLVDSEQEKDEENDTEDYENPGPFPKVPPVPPRPPQDDTEDYENPDLQAPPVPPPPSRRAVSEEPKLLLPIAKPKKEDILKMIKEKARLGFDKVHEQLLRRTRQNATEKRVTEKKGKIYNRSNSESSDRNRKSKAFEERRLTKSFSQKDDKVEEYRHSKRISEAYELNKGRPLPALPPKNINVTDDDKVEFYDEVEGSEIVFTETVDDHGAVSTNKTDTLARFPDLHRIGQADQTGEDFYTYTVEELVECLKMCKLEKFAIICSTNKLDGAFFRNFEFDQLKKEPFFLNTLDQVKVKKIIEEGWRPKTE